MPKKKSIDRGELSTADERYCQARASGLSQRAAYRASRQTACNDNTADVAACRLESDSKIALRIAELKRRAADGLILDRDGIAAMLAELAIDSGRSDSIRLKAADQLARIIGAYDDRQSLDIRAAVITGNDRAAALKAYLSDMTDDRA